MFLRRSAIDFEHYHDYTNHFSISPQPVLPPLFCDPNQHCFQFPIEEKILFLEKKLKILT